MANIVIKRCPVCPNIRRRAQEVVWALSHDQDLKARVEDGVEGEFSVLVDGVPLLQRNGESLPTTLEVEVAVANALPIPLGL